MNKKEETDMSETVELQTPSNTDTSVKDVIESDTPLMTSPEWSEYVLGLFEDKELIDGNPLVAGLRRVAELVLGQIVYSGPSQVFPVTTDKGAGRATVVFTVEFENGTR